MARQFHRLVGASSIVLLANCEGILPTQRERTGAPGQQPAMVEESRPKEKTPTFRRATEVAMAQAEPAFEQIRQSLRQLVVAEQGFFAETGVYTHDLDKLAIRKEGESEIKFLWLGPEGWAARGTHPKLTGRDCVIFVGATKALPVSQRYQRRGRPGVPVCDVPPGPQASAVTTHPPPIDTTSALDVVSPSVQMKVDLRKLVQAQDAYHGTMGTYSRNIETLPLQFAWQDKVKVSVVDADARSWSARATHSLHPEMSCVIWFGPVVQPPTTGQRRSPQRSGIPVCDG